MTPENIIVLSVATVVCALLIAFVFWMLCFVKDERKQDRLIRELRDNE